MKSSSSHLQNGCLLPVVREVRKCVAKELVDLQEKLDSSEETQFKIVEPADAEGGDLTDLDLQKEESSGKEVNKSEVEVSLVTKQPVDDVKTCVNSFFERL
ncbi:hypothetical protein L6452_19507 [Arctium lappa]|uniref:Uncharacterized protein n=1 Tax=Arctium lappa TaxID=4217 RepID=A0ACB9B9M0_ARCLA|nr:hypothetical protein L6452_19507 [Arctium lappa]